MSMNETIAHNRIEIDKIDKSIIDLLKQRFESATAIGREKQILGVGALDLSREQDVLDDRANYAESKGLNPDFIKRLIQLVMDESKSIQENLE